LPPKRLLATTFIPSAWIDDTLISERRAGLTKYLNDVLQSPEYKGNPVLVAFLSQSTPTSAFDLEDALPSTLSRKAALDLKARSADVTPIAAAYYENWATSPSVENIDFSKFDIIFFGKFTKACDECFCAYLSFICKRSLPPVPRTSYPGILMLWPC
jgi:chitinase